ncbi:helix-turn-helix domain-containing protein [Mycobacteroides chelonae]|nr:helix-turn-helix transcriptional regulator [Mycobacteroides chelonae]QQG89990.1 helix-turn-helix transcriptional regulator [Mycobacteroides chelonae]QQG94808.1 helix-turn-helix transcriptional regulator [Mycobacteroides chelonae]
MSKRFSAQRLAQARLARGLSVAELAQRMGVDAETVRHWEAGQVVPGPRNRPRLAAELEVPIESLDEEAQTPLTLVDLRRRAGLIQAELAKKIGISATMVSNWERGKMMVPNEQFYPLSVALNVTPFALSRAVRTTYDHFNPGQRIPGVMMRTEPITSDSFTVDPVESIHAISEYDGPRQNNVWELTSPQVDWVRFRSKNIPTTAEVHVLNQQLGADYVHRYNHIQRRVAGAADGHPVYRVRWQQSAHDGLNRYEMAETVVRTTFKWRDKTLSPPDNRYLNGDVLIIIVHQDDSLVWVENQLSDERRVSLWFHNVNPDGRTNVITLHRDDDDPRRLAEYLRDTYTAYGLTATNTCGELYSVASQNNSPLTGSDIQVIRNGDTDIESVKDLDRKFTLALMGVQQPEILIAKSVNERLDDSIGRLSWPAKSDSNTFKRDMLQWMNTQILNGTVIRLIQQFSEVLGSIEAEDTPIGVRRYLLNSVTMVRALIRDKIESSPTLMDDIRENLDSLEKRWQSAVESIAQPDVQSSESIEQQVRQWENFLKNDAHRRAIEDAQTNSLLSTFVVDPQSSLHSVSIFADFENPISRLIAPEVPDFSFQFSDTYNPSDALVIDYVLKADMSHRYNHNQKQTVIDAEGVSRIYNIRWQNYSHDHIYRYADARLVNDTFLPIFHQALNKKQDARTELLIIIVDGNDRLSWIDNQLHKNESAILWPNFLRDGIRPIMSTRQREGDSPVPGYVSYETLGLTERSSFGEFVEAYYAYFVDPVNEVLGDALIEEIRQVTSGIHPDRTLATAAPVDDKLTADLTIDFRRSTVQGR